MIASNTPRTDAALTIVNEAAGYSRDVSHLVANADSVKFAQISDLARRLERDRAELIAALDSIALCDHPNHPLYGDESGWHGSEAEFITALRDQARAALAQVQP